jgi:K+-transporting ATPase KdpF subunit
LIAARLAALDGKDRPCLTSYGLPCCAACFWQRWPLCAFVTPPDMISHLMLAGVTAIALLGYLIAVLVRPEKF